ncbi:hypothetical protein CEQ90_09370 [Lewinellaceae bacterium SD302]|nr:hypothetical protein CEQ90_09370 [Lewinellaceae bacterium SD302]
MKYLFFSLLLSFLAMCSTPKESTEASATLTLAGTSWQLKNYQAIGKKMQAAQDDKARLFFNAEGGIGGNTGCNSMGGDYQLKGNQLSIQAFSTEMYCEDIAEQELAINEIMRKTMTASIEGDQLILRRDNGQLVYVKAKKMAAAEKTSGNETPAQYDRNATQNDGATTKANTVNNGPVEMTGLFRYMADAAIFIRCSDQQRFGVSMSGNFKAAEQAYTKMDKNGAPALMSLEVAVTRNSGEGFPESITIQRVLTSSAESECGGE